MYIYKVLYAVLTNTKVLCHMILLCVLYSIGALLVYHILRYIIKSE